MVNQAKSPINDPNDSSKFPQHMDPGPENKMSDPRLKGPMLYIFQDEENQENKCDY